MSARLPHGTPAWFEMVGRQMCAAAARAGLPPTLDLSLVERFTDGAELSPGFVQGIRFDIHGGAPSFRAGALPDERGDITIAVTAAASRELNALHGADPRFPAALERLRRSGELCVEGDVARLGEWFADAHDPIVDNTLF